VVKVTQILAKLTQPGVLTDVNNLTLARFLQRQSFGMTVK
jgi:hypothetical protein